MRTYRHRREWWKCATGAWERGTRPAREPRVEGGGPRPHADPAADRLILIRQIIGVARELDAHPRSAGLDQLEIDVEQATVHATGNVRRPVLAGHPNAHGLAEDHVGEKLAGGGRIERAANRRSDVGQANGDFALVVGDERERIARVDLDYATRDLGRRDGRCIDHRERA
jgi:hypothetical protein